MLCIKGSQALSKVYRATRLLNCATVSGDVGLSMAKAAALRQSSLGSSKGMGDEIPVDELEGWLAGNRMFIAKRWRG